MDQAEADLIKIQEKIQQVEQVILLLYHHLKVTTVEQQVVLIHQIFQVQEVEVLEL